MSAAKDAKAKPVLSLAAAGVPPVRHVQGPAEFTDGEAVTGSVSLFLAGGISGCPQWQDAVRESLQRRGRVPGLVLLNPRRAHFDVHDTSLADAQIRWEHAHLQRATAVSFWFPADTLCPITLYELGVWSHKLTPAPAKV